ncbi:MAG: toxin TcdB middle/N-terminal domain-containing protein [Thermodesulfobacteriota bacterium]
MIITYFKHLGEIYIDKIEYTGNSDTGLSPKYWILFWREPLLYVPTMYTSNAPVQTACRLKSILIHEGAYLLREYILNYATSTTTNRTLLISVTKEGTWNGLEDVLPDMTFEYQTANNAFGPSTQWSSGHNAADRLGDFNGDGKTDVIQFLNGNSYVWLSTGSGFTTPAQWGSGHTDSDKLGDFNGDGKTDVIQFLNGNSYVWLSTGSGFAVPTQWGTGNTLLDQLGDFNGDGKTDLIRFLNGYSYVWLSTGSGFSSSAQWGSGHTDTDKLGDFNGDGRTDVIKFSNGYSYVWLSTGSNFTAPTQWGRFHPADNQLGDFNGDGKTDVIGLSPWLDFYDAYVWLSTGSGFTTKTLWGEGHLLTDQLADFNGDGRADVIQLVNGASYVRLSIGNGFTDWAQWSTGNTLLDQLGDFNGDGKRDVIQFSNGNSYVWLSDGPYPDLLAKIDNGIGSTTTITYKPSSDYSNTVLPFVIHTISSSTVDDGNGNVAPTNYTYSGGLYDPEDREFRGFGYIKATDPAGTTTETWFHQDDIFNGLAYDQKIKDSSGNPYTRTANTYASTSPYGGVNFPYLEQKDDYVYDGTPTYKQATTSFTYDAYGNTTRTYYHGDVAVTGDERDEHTEYTWDTVNWLFLPSHLYTADNAGIIKAQTWLTYDSRGNLLTKTAWFDGGTDPVITYSYDSYGNQTSVTDARGYTTTITYDSIYTYPATITNPLGHVTATTYVTRFGKPLTETDANGNTTIYEYDLFGRLVRVIRPYDETSTYGTESYEYIDGPIGVQKVITYSTEQSGTANYLWKESYFDGLGRTIKTRAEGPDGKVAVAETIYDERGLVASTSLPYFEGLETPRWTSYTYDPIGRVTEIARPDGTFIAKSYLRGRTAIIDANGHGKVEEKDVYGRLIKVEEYTGTSPSLNLYATTAYEYNVLSNLLKVTDAANNQTTTTYDTLSRKTSMNDPDMGSWTYQYDANGNLTAQTDAKGQTILLTYDVLNRITKKDYPAGADVVYTYDETFSTNPKGRLTTVSDASGTENYYYDKLGRTVKTVKTVDGIAYPIETTYDSLGRMPSIKYPDGEIVNYSYDTGGNLSGVSGFAAYGDYNALGQAANITYANGVNTTLQYYPLNNRLYSITTNSPAQGLQNISYTYDNTGNVTSIADYISSSRTQDFAYDALDRLTEAQCAAYGTITYEYNQIGNITYNSQVGTYAYGTRPHAVLQAGSSAYTYDANGNMTGREGKTITYDYENRPVSMAYDGSTAGFVYDHSGQRIKKITPSSATVYIDQLFEGTNGAYTKYIFAGGRRIASKTSTDIYYYHTDHLGSSNVITDAAANKVQEIYYYPFGGTRSNIGSIDVKHKYTGQEEDIETGLYYYGARYYDPNIGRFISADTIVPDYSNPQALNRYSYVLNNPLLYIDPTGHYSWTFNDFCKYSTPLTNSALSGVSTNWGVSNIDYYLSGPSNSFASGTKGYTAIWADSKTVKVTMNDIVVTAVREPVITSDKPTPESPVVSTINKLADPVGLLEAAGTSLIVTGTEVIHYSSTALKYPETTVKVGAVTAMAVGGMIHTSGWGCLWLANEIKKSETKSVSTTSTQKSSSWGNTGKKSISSGKNTQKSSGWTSRW